jgi:S-adenosylmethionine:tRNA ribosyltransferase-isomerase
VRTELFDYELPEAQVAQRPALRRDEARMLVLESTGVRHETVSRWPDFVARGALIVLNDTRVTRARLIGRRLITGGRVEILLLERDDASAEPHRARYVALGRANRPLLAGHTVEVGPVRVEVEAQRPDGTLAVMVCSDEPLSAVLERHGRVPLPPYVRRTDDADDADRYQTVYAKAAGSVAAPTAGLHLTNAMLERLRARGVEVGTLTLHIGLGTFRPVSASDLDAHAMHRERYFVPESLTRKVDEARARGAPVIAVGTTVVRALESACDPEDPRRVLAGAGETRLLIQPGYRFGPVDGLLTNFHMPKSTLLALVAAFAGREEVLGAYRSALAAGYRFLSYGDAMWIPERRS